jgi:DNA-binding transcriptional LysR family regulator
MPDPPTEPIWITVHRDVRDSPRVRVVLDHLAACVAADRLLLAGP